MSGTNANFFPQWQILYNGVDITQKFLESFKEIRYDEVIGGETCQLKIYFSDWNYSMQNGPPSKGDFVEVSIGYKGQALTSCGTFEIDEFELQGPPEIFIIKCVEAGITGDLRTLNDYAYENTSLTGIASQVAGRHGWTPVTDAVSPDVHYDRITQNHESDLAFLKRIAGQHNYEFQIRNNQLIFYNRLTLENQPPSGTVDKLSNNVKLFRLHDQTLRHRAYKKAKVTYLDPNTKNLLSSEATNINIPTGDLINSTERVENSQQATAKAQSYLHEHNMLSQVGEITLVGTMQYRAGTTVALKNFGVFDNYIYIVDKARHIMNRMGYLTRLELRTTLNANPAQPQKGKGAGVSTVYVDPTTGRKYSLPGGGP